MKQTQPFREVSVEVDASITPGERRAAGRGEAHDRESEKTDGDLLKRFDALVILEQAAGEPAALRQRDPALWKAAAGLRIVQVRASLDQATHELAEVESGKAWVLRIPCEESAAQRQQLALGLRRLGIVRPLGWFENVAMADALQTWFAPLKVARIDDSMRVGTRTLTNFDLLVVPSEPAAAAVTKLMEGCEEVIEVVACQGVTDAGKLAARLRDVGRSRRASAEPLNVLVLYDQNWVHVKTIAEYLESFVDYSAHRCWYAPGTHDAPCRMDLSIFDAVVIHYSVRLYLRDFISPYVAEALRGYGGLKVLFIQDEYDVPNVTCDHIESLGLQVVFTCVPQPHIGKVYDPRRFPHVRFIETLTGWIPARLTGLHAPLPPTRRSLMIAYRGRRLPYWYGKLGQEKLVIGQRMREICSERGIPCDIAWEDDDRIYGDAWYEFMGSARATLGSESGSQLFDWNGESRRWVEQALHAKPDLSFEEAYERFLHRHDGRIEMNQISPRVFEAVALRTALILFEGNYSGIVQPDVHYIPLKKDFSNIDEVLAKLHDDDYIERITERAYEDVVASGRYSYPSFIRRVDEVLEQEIGDGAGRRLVAAVIGSQRELDLKLQPEGRAKVTAMLHHLVTNSPIGPPPPDAIERLGRDWQAFGRRFMPAPLRRVLKPPLRFLWRSLRRFQSRWRARRQG